MYLKKNNIQFDRSIYDDANEEKALFKAAPGVSEDLVREISKQKNEPEWMLKKTITSI